MKRKCVMLEVGMERERTWVGGGDVRRAFVYVHISLSIETNIPCRLGQLCFVWCRRSNSTHGVSCQLVTLATLHIILPTPAHFGP